MELSACIVVYNGADEALRAAQTVLDCTRRHPLTLYLVDNASPDGSGQRLTLYVSTEDTVSRDTGFRFAKEGPVKEVLFTNFIIQ